MPTPQTASEIATFATGVLLRKGHLNEGYSLDNAADATELAADLWAIADKGDLDVCNSACIAFHVAALHQLLDAALEPDLKAWRFNRHAREIYRAIA